MWFSSVEVGQRRFVVNTRGSTLGITDDKKFANMDVAYRIPFFRLVAITLILLIGVACSRQDVSDNNTAEFSDLDVSGSIDPDAPIHPIFRQKNLDKNKVALGELLFHDPRLSSNNNVSCANCHNLAAGGVDSMPGSIGVNGGPGEVNSPTVFNAGLNFSQFWDGRAETLDEQVNGPIHNPVEMDSNWPDIIDKLKTDKKYRSLFFETYSDGITAKNIRDAITVFEQSLVTVNSPFDRYLLGDKDAISVNARMGYEKFKEYGCIACHQGSNVGGNLYQPFGVMGDYFADRGLEIKKSDLGRYNVTGLEDDKYVFKVPSLRLAVLTAPYFHDGSAATLKDAVRIMVKYQLGRAATEQDEDLIVEFLHSLVGEYKGKRLGQ